MSVAISKEDLGGAEFAVFSGIHPEIAADPRLARVVATVEATREEQSLLWAKWKDTTGWKEDLSGWGATVGTFGGMPVHISILFATVEGRTVMLWHATSVVVHHEMIKRWLDAYVTAPKIRVDADRFHEVVNELRDMAAAGRVAEHA